MADVRWLKANRKAKTHIFHFTSSISHNTSMSNKYKISAAFFLTVVTIIFLTSFDSLDVMKSNGGPPYNTKAPGEKTCSGVEGSNSCHSGGIADNAGTATKSITFSGGTNYIAGQTYTVTVSISHPSRNRFGFQIVSLKNGSNANIGTVALTDTNRTRSQIPTYGSYQTRNYVMHILGGSYGTSNACTWSYSWTAPSTNQGAITFYACLMAANGNNTNDSGDQTYYTQLTINPSITGVFEDNNENSNDIIIYPNPVKNSFTINYKLTKPSLFKAELLDAQGKLVQLLYNNDKANGTINEKITLSENSSPGFYFVKFSIDNKEQLKKIIVQ